MDEKTSESPAVQQGGAIGAAGLAPSSQDLPVLPARGPPAGLPVVAIGASAGGLEAASELLGNLPTKAGRAYIVVQHLDPTHKSLLAELLAEHTAMKVGEATDGCALLADQVYVIPPGRYLSVSAGAVHLSEPAARHAVRLPFDFLLASLAQNCGSRTVCIVLSGTGGDGSGGAAALKAAGGYIIAQQPEEAEFDGMPRSMIATGLVDQVLPLRKIPQALAGLGANHAKSGVRDEEVSPFNIKGLNAIIAFLKDNTSHDFTQYKPGTLERRIERRTSLLGLERGDLTAYHDLLRESPTERDLLVKDLLINVTSFFRDAKIFDALAAKIVPDLIQGVAADQALRVWVAGCSTGEEAYSLAMICRDAIEASGRSIKLQVFASDVDSGAIAIAREGLYSQDSVSGISAERLARHFIKEDLGYRVATALRGDVVFTVQDVLSDPPFSRIDLVSCRNLLIYLNAEAQAKVISLFHFALREGGILVLGSSETIGNADARFEIISKTDRFYRHIARSRVGDAGFPLSFGSALPLLANGKSPPPETRPPDLAAICRRAIVASLAPAAILINRERQCLYSVGPTERYLRIAPGYATHDLLAMASPALRTKLRLAIDKANKTSLRIDGGRSRHTHGGNTIWFDVNVQSLAGDHKELMLIWFVDQPPGHGETTSGGGRIDAARNAELERELEATQAELQSAILNQETSSQEQRAINEEALSVNEEFQSTNEELLTSKEELQSLNEELNALNGQLQQTIERQQVASDDLQNVLYSTNVGTIFLDLELKIRFYTPAIKSFFNILAGDVGRPLGDLRPLTTDADLLADAHRVVVEETSIDREVGGPKDEWFLRRIFPYRAHDNHVGGVVITYADITHRKQTARALEAAKSEAERANLAKSRFLAAASHDLRQPLQSLTLLQELLAQSGDEQKRKTLLARFGQTLGSMSGMLNALLDINQIEAGVVEAKVAIFPISNVLDRVRDEFTYLAQTHNLSLHVLPCAALVQSDPRLLEQIIRNLLGNAIKYTKRGKILLGCRRRGDSLRIEVWDTGIGIPEDQIHAIFDEFHQVGNAARERSHGLGLGLSIVQQLGRLLGHDISVRSVGGKGSVFTVTINRVDNAIPKNPAQASEDDSGAAGNQQCKIVIVDDDPDVLELLEQLLKADGHIVRVASDAASALKLIAGGAIRPEILLTDYNLPGGTDGLGLLAQLRANRPDGLPAIVLTGDISSETLTRISGEDCVQLSKPVKPQELMDSITRLCVRSAPRIMFTAPDTATPGVAIAYVVDDDPETRATIKEVLEADGRLVEDFASAEAFLAAYNKGGEGCLLLDAHMPGMGGVALLDTLRARGDHLPTILITGSGDIGLAVQSMRRGACDFIEKPVGREDLLASIARAIDQSHDIRLVEAAHSEAAAHVATLTPRQREVMDMVLAGHPSKNIAADLGISQRTVENHRAEIMHKMRAKSMPELARTAQAALD